MEAGAVLPLVRAPTMAHGDMVEEKFLDVMVKSCVKVCTTTVGVYCES